MKGKRVTIIVILAAVFLAVIGYKIYQVNYNDRIRSGVTINNHDLSKLTYDKAKKISCKLQKNILSHKIVIENGDQKYSIGFADAGIGTNMEEILQSAYNYGKRSTIVKSVMSMFTEQEKHFSSKLLLDEDKINAYIKKLEKSVNKPTVDAKIIGVTANKLRITESKDGIELDTVKLKKELYDKVINYKSGDITLMASTVQRKARVSSKILKTIDSRLSSYSTYYSEYVAGRASNIKKAAKAVNGTLLMPKEEFSFNRTTGERTIKRGYREAPIIVNNKLQPGPAGGVCQVSSTLYNAVIRANIRSIERRNHSLAPAYMPPGFDATVSSNIDYRFVNTLKYPIYIRGFAHNGKVTFSVYGNNYYTKKKYVLVNDIIEVIEPKTIYNNVETLPQGEEEVIQQKHKGYIVKVFLITMENGKEKGRTLISRDKYVKTDEIINVGY
ncbi:VanW family protein [Clostridium oryzae]|uniref:Vancomycin B-type resistance protein VanW n=1 Tax=Clostridium oryzae TaxID=1450648 RepID=A0A1V4IHA6_9CLOT|nr:VanW family protein [Clostridium oryzae]OPJ59378.1 vancomycin B-type resistance protein VanW [Clostridium oryzae]